MVNLRNLNSQSFVVGICLNIKFLNLSYVAENFCGSIKEKHDTGFIAVTLVWELR